MMTRSHPEKGIAQLYFLWRTSTSVRREPRVLIKAHLPDLPPSFDAECPLVFFILIFLFTYMCYEHGTTVNVDSISNKNSNLSLPYVNVRIFFVLCRSTILPFHLSLSFPDLHS